MNRGIKAVKRILLIRHGEAEHNVSGSYGGWSDSGLTDIGIQQAKDIATIVASITKDWNAKLYSSDTNRALATAKIIAGQTGHEITMDWRLRELHTGIASVSIPGITPQKRPISQPVYMWRPYTAGEAWGEFANRVYDFMNDVSSSDIIIVTHNGTQFNIMLWWIGVRNKGLGDMFFNMDNCGLTLLEVNKYGENQVSFQNRIYNESVGE